MIKRAAFKKGDAVICRRVPRNMRTQTLSFGRDDVIGVVGIVKSIDSNGDYAIKYPFARYHIFMDRSWIVRATKADIMKAKKK